MFQPMLARWPAVSLGLVTLAASAQAPVTPPSPAAVPPAVAQTPATSGEYRSALEGYQPYSENKMVPWKDANDTVGKIGGWRAYAREVAEGQGQHGHAGHTPPAVSGPKPAASQAKP